MREIKFRAWVMGDFDGNNFENYMEEDVQTLIEPFEAHENGDIILMQYTGIKDKNGVEVFEGDIFKAPFDFGPGGFHERTSQVYFHTFRGYQWEYWDLHNLVVLGNVYQHPHLWKGES